MDDPTDFAASIRYALTERAAAGGRVELVLDLFRGAAPALTRTVANVAPGEVRAVARRCRIRLEESGAHAVMRAPADELDAPVHDPGWAFAG